MSGWKECWFYIGNQVPTLLERTTGVPKITGGWMRRAPELSQVNELLTKIKVLRDEGVIGVSMVYSWICRRIQPLQRRTLFGFEYMGLKDPSRFSTEQIHQDEALRRVSRVLLDAETEPYMQFKLFTMKILLNR
jgi:hypothetical protein